MQLTIVIAILAVTLFFAVRWFVRIGKGGGGCSCGNCKGCPMKGGKECNCGKKLQT
ncbi:MAG: hypothetical protein K6A67_03600 [Bacteroidales bacterium]|nr:hypothetical protein [Bacteroidales bacterium]